MGISGFNMQVAVYAPEIQSVWSCLAALCYLYKHWVAAKELNLSYHS